MSGFVYFIGPDALMYRKEGDELSVVKIGYSSEFPQKRLDQLAVGSPVCLQLIAYLRAPMQFEKDLHEEFAEYVSHREWFTVTGRLRQFLAQMMGAQTHECVLLAEDVLGWFSSNAVCDHLKYRWETGIVLSS